MAARKYLVFAALALLLPIYSLLLASIVLLLFIAAGVVIVPLGQTILDRYESRQNQQSGAPNATAQERPPQAA